MKLSGAEFEKMFDDYRGHLRREIHCFCDCVSVLHQINDHTHDHLAEINLSSGFFHTVEDALFNTVILWADKLFDEQGERGFFNFLTFVEYNRAWLTTEELKRRKGYPDGHWMLKDACPSQRIQLKLIESRFGLWRPSRASSFAATSTKDTLIRNTFLIDHACTTKLRLHGVN